jgi:hypothetical protein
MWTWFGITTKSWIVTLPDRIVDLRTSMKRVAMRSVWKSDLPPAALVVAKNVRGNPFELSGSEGREGFDIAGAKAHPFLDRYRHG